MKILGPRDFSGSSLNIISGKCGNWLIDCLISTLCANNTLSVCFLFFIFIN